MARRHPQKGCHCTTCTNERLYNQTTDRRDYYRAYREGLDDLAYARRMSVRRAYQRRQAEARDLSRLEDLHRRAAT